jgi:hypothetical protein
MKLDLDLGWCLRLASPRALADCFDHMLHHQQLYFRLARGARQRVRAD